MVDPEALRAAARTGTLIICGMELVPLVVGILIGRWITLRSHDVPRWWMAFIPKKFWSYFE